MAFTGAGALVESSDGIWHGPATKGATQVEVSVDYKGNITTR